MEMASSRPYFADLTKNDEEESLIVEEEFRNNNLHQDGTVQHRPWDPSFTNDVNNGEIPDENRRPLSDEQALALDLIREGRNVFLTGVAGTGKSLVLKKALEYVKETYEHNEYVAVAPTGSTAIALEGQTVHSFAGIGIPKIYTDFRKMKSNKKIKKRWENLKILVLDEVSMVSGEFFDSLSRVVSDIRNDPRPFGGIQLIVCGDFLQLSPIAPRKWEVEQNMNGIREKEGLETREEAWSWLFLNRGFCFQSEAWSKSAFEVVELKHVFRQSNRNFVNILRDIRVGSVTPDTVRYLRENCERPLPPNKFGVQPTILHSKNVNVGKENLVDLEKLSGHTVIYEAFDEVEREKGVGKWVEKKLFDSSFFKSCTAEKHLQLKIGAQVMLIKNLGHNSMLTNGSRGTVVGFRTVKRSTDAASLLPGVTSYPVVRFKNGLQRVITPQKFQSRIFGMGTCTRTAIPIKLAWAITTHKAQGLTLDYVIADVGQVFAEAQLYVALSRVSDETGLELRNFSEKRVKANPLALRFHNDPSRNFPFWWDGDGSKPKIMIEPSKKRPQNSVSCRASGTPSVLPDGQVLKEQILKEQTVLELKQMLREQGFKVSGRKAELIERLRTRGEPLAPRFRNSLTRPVPFLRDGVGSNSKTTIEQSGKKAIDCVSRRANETPSALPDEQILKEHTVLELKQMLRERGLKVSGRKAELIKRLRTIRNDVSRRASGSPSQIPDEQILKERTVVELKQMLRERGLKVSGRKAELIERLRTMG
jgi:ATP-dependent DNA helicase PIF1